MKIFGIGLTKTGTTSLSHALRILGYSTIHYPSNPTTFREILNGRFNFSFLNHYDAATDITICRYYAQLDKLYPGGKFILTVRDISSWLESCQRHWARRQPSPDNIDFNTLIDISVYGCACFNMDRFRHVYEQHVRDVKHYFAGRAQDLLELDIVGGAGWVPLCRFLDCRVPDAPFPELHKSRRAGSV